MFKYEKALVRHQVGTGVPRKSIVLVVIYF